ncbi:MAG: hypothetical protein IK139_00500, partial [Lachnospiraceae bacterium]|nr:hypothetical protein [Lachnospiraceae bacterium]
QPDIILGQFMIYSFVSPLALITHLIPGVFYATGLGSFTMMPLVRWMPNGILFSLHIRDSNRCVH